MRFLLLLTVIINGVLFLYGQGFFGTPPAEQGRDPHPLTQRNQAAVTLGAPIAVPDQPLNPTQ